MCVVCLQDTAGQERYRTITTAYYRGAMGFLLMYDITSQESFCAVQDWWVDLQMWRHRVNPPCIAVRVCYPLAEGICRAMCFPMSVLSVLIVWCLWLEDTLPFRHVFNTQDNSWGKLFHCCSNRIQWRKIDTFLHTVKEKAHIWQFTSSHCKIFTVVKV